MNSFKEKTVYGLRNLARFSGRDSRDQFLPYLAFCFLSLVVLYQGAAVFLIPSPFRFAAGEEINVEQLTQQGLAITAVATAAFVLLMAASIARRLRDAGRSTLWGLLPLPPLCAGLFINSAMFEAGTNELNLQHFVAGFAVSGLYFLCLGVLGWFLTRPSTQERPLIATHS